MDPRASLFTLIVGYAYDHGKRPSEVYLDYLDNPWDYQLLFSFGAFRAEQEAKAVKEARTPKPM